MKRIINILTIFILYSTLISCENSIQSQNEEPLDKPIRPLGFLGFGADSSLYKISCYSKLPERKESTFVINNYTDYDAFKNYASCLKINSWPSVDFEKNTMLAGVRIMGTCCAYLIPEKFSLTKNNANYKFVVTIIPGAYWAMSTIFYWVLVDKIRHDSCVEFIIEYVTSK